MLVLPPPHQEFPPPLPYSSPTVSNAVPQLSRGLSHLTYGATYAPFTPNNSEQRLHPTYYRGCWHVVSRCFLKGYRQSARMLAVPGFFPPDRGLRSENLLPSRGVAASGFRPLRTIPPCSLP